MLETLRAMRSNLTISKKLLAEILVLGLTASVFAVGLMFVAGYLISASADNISSILMLNLPLAFVQIFGLGKPIARYFERLKSHDWVLRLTSTLRYQLFTVVQRWQRANQRLTTGDVLESLAHDIEQVQNFYLRTAFPVLIAWAVGVLLVIIAGCFSPALLVFALGSVLFLGFILPALAAALNKARITSIGAKRTRLHEDVTDAVLGAQDVAIAGRGISITQTLQEKFDALHNDERRLCQRDRVRLVLIQALLLAACLVLVWWSAQQFGGVAGGRADWIVAVALGFFPLIEIFAPLPQQFESGVSQTESLQRLASLGLSSQITPPDSSAQPEQNQAGDGVAASSGIVAPSGVAAPESSTDFITLTPPYDIAFNHVSFAYPDGAAGTADRVTDVCASAADCTADPAATTGVVTKLVLKDITLTIPYGQKIAVLGKSGSGKTTLARLLHGDVAPVGASSTGAATTVGASSAGASSAGAAPGAPAGTPGTSAAAPPTRGEVTIAGCPIAKIHDSIWDYVGLISQDSYIFAMSIQDNLRIGKIEATESELWDVLDAVDLKSFVESLPDGLNTMADEAGLRFSGGQRQRLVLARMLLANPPIVVLDEPTVGLDPVTEQVVMDTIARVLADKTVVMITHHLQGIEAFDRVIFVEDGQMVMDGSPQELAQTNERYQKLLMFDRGVAAR